MEETIFYRNIPIKRFTTESTWELYLKLIDARDITFDIMRLFGFHYKREFNNNLYTHHLLIELEQKENDEYETAINTLHEVIDSIYNN